MSDDFKALDDARKLTLEEALGAVRFHPRNAAWGVETLAAIDGLETLIRRRRRDHRRQILEFLSTPVGAVCVALCCATAVFALGLRRPAATSVALDGEVVCASFASIDRLHVSDVTVRRVDVHGIDSIVGVADVAATVTAAAGTGALGESTVSAIGTSIVRVEAAKGSRGDLEVAADAGSITVLAVGLPVRGDFVGSDGVRVVVGDDYRSRAVTPDTGLIDFKCDRPTAAVPFLCRLDPIDRLQFSSFSVSGVRLSGVDVGGEPASTIKAGRLALPEGGVTVDLQEYDSVVLHGFEGRVVRLSYQPATALVHAQLKLSLRGHAASVLVGPYGMEVDITPNWLDRWRKDERLHLFVAAFVFLWSVSWTVLKVVLKGGMAQ